MSNKILSAHIKKALSLAGISWKIKGSMTIPTTEIIEETLDILHDTLYDEGDGSHMTTGGLLMMKSNGRYDVYTYLGEYNDDIN